jgi:hypothetical protein
MAFRTKLAKAEPIIAGLRKARGRSIPGPPCAPSSRAHVQGLLARSTGFDQFLQHLIVRRQLLAITLTSAEYEKDITRYCAQAPSPFALAASIASRGYLSHATAAYLHGLLPFAGPVYLNIEQSAKPRAAPGALSQAAIDRAFQNQPRQSNLSYRNGELTVTRLAGKNTRRAGVALSEHPAAKGLPVTTLERTLIDLTVRPHYGGGLAAVLAAYRAARERASIAQLLALLDQVDHVYPYAQSIGFLLERAGYAPQGLAPLKARVGAYDFYLAHAMRERAYAPEWRLHYPRELD